MQNEMIELELVDDSRVLVTSDWSKLYNIREHTMHKFKLCSKFPFITLRKVKFVIFTCQDQYTTMHSNLDSKYKVNCTLPQLATLFDVAFKEFDKTIVEHDISS